jgi:hypothetical protein
MQFKLEKEVILVTDRQIDDVKNTTPNKAKAALVNKAGANKNKANRTAPYSLKNPRKK